MDRNVNIPVELDPHPGIEARQSPPDAQAEIEALTRSLTQSFEEVNLLHRISERMKVNRKPEAFFSQICRDVREVLASEKIVVLLGRNDDCASEVRLVAAEGDLALAEQEVRLVWQRMLKQAPATAQVLIDSNVDGPYVHRWPESIRNIAAVPIKRDDALLGALVAINKLDKPDFDSMDTRLMLSVATESAIYLENFRLYEDMQSLMMGSLRALTSSIDAKDPYTCGHSERVALISHWLAHHLQRDPREVQDAYLGGLLHDVGKIGVSEAILCKPGKLTDEEFVEIRRHPQIGANILEGIKQLVEVNRAVLTHHERMDGNGYPQGLRGAAIPLIGRIVGLADCFDAMINDRVYRHAMPLDTALAEIRRFSGTHFDPDITAILLNTDVSGLLDQLHEIKSHQKDFHHLYRTVYVN